MAGNHYLTKLGTWTFGVQDENNWWPDLASAEAFLLSKSNTTKRPSVTVLK